MGLSKYRLLVGTVVSWNDKDRDRSPHFQILVKHGDEYTAVSINVASVVNPPNLLVFHQVDYDEEWAKRLPREDGLFRGDKMHHLDYVKDPVAHRSSFHPIPAMESGADNDLFDLMIQWFKNAKEEKSQVYVWGEEWRNSRPNKQLFPGYSFTNGVHDVHMNQGSSGRFRRDNRAFGDGGLLIRNEDDTFKAFFSAFQVQSWNNDENGNPLSTFHVRGFMTERESDDLSKYCTVPATDEDQERFDRPRFLIVAYSSSQVEPAPPAGRDSPSLSLPLRKEKKPLLADSGELYALVCFYEYFNSLASSRQLSDEGVKTLLSAQRGLLYPSAYACFFTVWLKENSTLTLKKLSSLLRRLRNQIHKNRSHTYSSIITGVSPSLWKEWTGRDVSTLDHFPATFVNSGCQLWFHLKSAKSEVLQEIQQELHEGLIGYIQRLEFTNTHSREHGVLGGRFQENLRNPASPVEMLEHVLGSDGDARGSSFVFAQALEIRWDKIHDFARAKKTDMDKATGYLIGRKPYQMAINPSDHNPAHIKSSHVLDETGTSIKILRLGLPYGSGPIFEGKHPHEEGVYFAGFAKSAERFQMVLDHQTKFMDRLLQMTEAQVGGFFYIPSAKELNVEDSLGMNLRFRPDPWKYFPGVDWSRINRHFDQRSSNGRMFYNHQDYLFGMSTASEAEAKRLQPPSLRLLYLLDDAFDVWNDTWYRDRKQMEMKHLTHYLREFYEQNPHDHSIQAGSADQFVANTMNESVQIRRAWALRLTLGSVLVDKTYGKRGQLENGKNGANTYHIHPYELIVGQMPNSSLGEGCYVMNYIRMDGTDEKWAEERFNTFADFLGPASPVGHVVPGYSKVLEYGIKGLINELIDLEKSVPDGEGAKEKREFYRSSRIVLYGIQEYFYKYAELARNLAASHKSDELKRQNLEAIAQRMEYLASQPPRCLLEGAQLIFTLHSSLHASREPVAIGRLDYMLSKWENEALADPSFAQEVIDCFFLKIAGKILFNRATMDDHQPPGNMAMGNFAGPYPQGCSVNQWVQQVTIGGQIYDHKAGKPVPVYNAFTRHCIRAARRLPLNAPTVALRVFKDMPEDLKKELLQEAAESLLSGGAHPILVNDDKIVPGLQMSGDGIVDQIGVDKSDAFDYACDGCYEPQFVGRNWFTLGGLNTLQTLEFALNQGRTFLDAGPHFLRGKVISYRSPPANEITTYKKLEDIYLEHHRVLFAKQVESQINGIGRVSQVAPSPLMNLFIEGCLESGRDFYNGGAKYNVFGPCFTGLANTIESLYFISKHCFGNGENIPLERLTNCLLCNWGESMIDPLYHDLSHDTLQWTEDQREFKRWRQIALEMPRWGRGESRELDEFGNQFCVKVANVAIEVFRNPQARVKEALERFTKQGVRFCIQPGVGTFETYVEAGQACGASADGRLKAEPLATDMSATPSALDLRPTKASTYASTALKGVTNSTSFNFWNGSPFDMNVKEDFPVDQLAQFLHQFTDGDGTNILTVTVADTDTFEKAIENPEGYDLVRVRMGGWTENYISMMLRHQKTHIRRPFSLPDPK